MLQKLSSPTICLLTDFGTRDGYVGVMKGVILNIAPGTHLVDLTHDIPAQDLASASWVLRTSYRYFASNTIFLCVVDPGVGSTRAPLALRMGTWFFVGPDNGLFSALFNELPVHEAVALTNSAYHLSMVSNTFQGRDIFSPAAAHLANGTPLAELGPAIEPARLQRLVGQDVHRLTELDERVEGSVAHIDHFGNIITNILVSTASIQKDSVAAASKKLNVSLRISFPQKNVVIRQGRRFFAQEPGQAEDMGGPFFYTDSSGFIAVAVQNGDASSLLDIGSGERVVCEWSSEVKTSV